MVRRLADADPEVAKVLREEAQRQHRNLELIASENFVSEAVLEATGLRSHQQVRRGLPGTALLRRLRGRGRRRGSRHRPGQGALRRRARQRPAALRRPGQHGRLLHAAQAGRRRARAEPLARRASHRRQPGELLGQVLLDRRLRRAPRHRAHRPRPGPRPRQGAPPQAPHRRRLGVSAQDRLPAVRRDRPRGRRHAHGRHRASRRPGRRGSASLAGRARRLRHHHHAQDAARPAGRHGDVPREPRCRTRQDRDAGRAGWSAHARHRGQGRRPARGADAGVACLPAADRDQRRPPSPRPCWPGASGW